MSECVPTVLNPDETGYEVPPGARFHSGSCDAEGRHTPTCLCILLCTLYNRYICALILI